MAPIVLGIVSLVLLAVLTATIAWVGRGLYRPIEQAQPVDNRAEIYGQLEMLAKRIDENSEEVDRLKLAVSDGIERVHRAETRIAKTVQSARRLVRENGLEHPGIEAEADELRERDDTGSPEPELQLMPPRVDTPARPTGIPGITQADLDAIREVMDA